MPRFLTTTIILTYLLIIFGATVRVFGAGLACPDWPLCHGQLIPPFDLPVLLEWGHRLVASLVACCAVGIVWAALAQARYRQRIGRLALLALGLVIVQAVLGGLTVLKTLHFSTVMLHLATALLFLATLVWMRLRLAAPAPDLHVSCAARWSVGCALALLYTQIILGALVSSNYAGLACPDFPTCNGAWIPPLQGLVVLQFVHRVMAFVFLAALLWALVVLLRRSAGQIRWLAIAVGVGTLIQIQLGISNVLLHLPKAVTIAHTGLAALLFVLLVTLYYKVSHAGISSADQTAH